MAEERLVIVGLGMLAMSLASSLKLGRRKEEKNENLRICQNKQYRVIVFSVFDERDTDVFS